AEAPDLARSHHVHRLTRFRDQIVQVSLEIRILVAGTSLGQMRRHLEVERDRLRDLRAGPMGEPARAAATGLFQPAPGGRVFRDERIDVHLPKSRACGRRSRAWGRADTATTPSLRRKVCRSTSTWRAWA